MVCIAQNAALAASYDDCSKAFSLSNVKGWCSSPRQFTNVGAKPSGMEDPDCFGNVMADHDNDVWFKFTASATVANISVVGAIRNNPGGTLQNPQFAVYRGSCGKGMVQVGCISDGQGFHIVETFVSNLVIGATYYIRVDGRNNKTGTFQLCVNNYNPVPSPSSDCSTAVVLCDKSPFTVPSVTTAGRNKSELPPGSCVPTESQSAWYKWTCEESGTLTFSLKPINPSDDLDFVLFLLPNGVGDCSNKIAVRCMASGENVNQPYARWAKCTGATGLSAASTDIVEQEGCAELDDNFLMALRMEKGRSYALMVNNYHNTGNGFSVTFGGTGTFVGPVAHFTVSKLKVETNQPITIKNAATFPGGITKWEWNFGVDASPQTAKGQGPHTVKYTSPGKKSISLSIETSNGCKVTKVRTVEVTKPAPPPPPKPDPPTIPEPPAGPKPPPLLPVDSVAVSVSDSTQLISPASKPKEEEEEVEIPPQGASNSVPDTTMVVVTYDVKYVATVYFRADSASLEEKDFVTLDEVVKLMNQDPEYLAIVEGHTNNIPSDEYCLKLGSDRADAAIAFLNSKGIEDQRIIRKVFGKKRVITKDISLQNRRRNQRVEVKVVKKMD